VQQPISLNDQRNWIAKNPATLRQIISNRYKSSDGLIKAVKLLMSSLDRKMRPVVYGSAVNRLHFSYHLSYQDPGVRQIT